MEQSKNKRANNMLFVVSLLCIILIVAITAFTFTSKREEPVKEDVTKSSESVSGTVRENSTLESESKAERETTVENVTDADKEEKKSKESPKNEDSVKPTAATYKPVYELPVNGSITKSYSVDIPVYSLTMNDYRAHTGIDISCEQGSAVSACEAGVIKDISFDPLMGHTVTIEHNDGVCSSYMNLGENFPNDITVGASVSKGQLIGAVGNSAMVEIANEPHLHFEMMAAGAYVDPLTMIDAASISVMSENIVD